MIYSRLINSILTFAFLLFCPKKKAPRPVADGTPLTLTEGQIKTDKQNRSCKLSDVLT